MIYILLTVPLRTIFDTFCACKKNVTLYFKVSLIQSNYQVNYLVKAIVLTVHETNVTYHVTMLWNSLYLQFVIM